MSDCMHCGEKNVDHRHYAGCSVLVGKEKDTDKHGLARTDTDKEKIIRGVEQKVLEFVAEGTQVSVIQLDHSIEALDYDSIDVLDIVMELEESYSITIPDEDYEKWTTVQDIVDSVVKVILEKMGEEPGYGLR